MTFLRLSLSLLLAAGMALPAQAWTEPQRGTALRSDLMDALRPHAEKVFGTPVVFVVQDLRVEGDVAFGMLQPVRPDGTEISINDLQSPYADGEEEEFWGGPDMQALYQKSGDTWVAVHHTYGATDAWWADPYFCPVWHPVIPETCAN